MKNKDSSLTLTQTTSTLSIDYLAPTIEFRGGKPIFNLNDYAEKVLDNLRLGMTRQRAAEQVGLTAEQIDIWSKNHPRFRWAVKKSEADFEKDQLLALKEHTKKNWIPAMTMLERKWPEAWGQRTVKTGNLSNLVTERIKRCFKNKVGDTETLEVERSVTQTEPTIPDVVLSTGNDIVKPKEET